MAAGRNWRQSEFAGGICPFLLSVFVRQNTPSENGWIHCRKADGRSRAAALPFGSPGTSSIISGLAGQKNRRSARPPFLEESVGAVTHHVWRRLLGLMV